jgi:hypothetical protein
MIGPWSFRLWLLVASGNEFFQVDHVHEMTAWLQLCQFDDFHNDA